MKNFNNNFLFFIFLTPLCAIFLFFNISNALADTFITENIGADTIWIKEDSPYIIKNSIDVALSVTLTIDPGVVVKFNPTAGAAINVFGDLVANGEVDNKIYFTSNYDDTVGGDTDGDYYCYENVDEDGNDLGQVCDSSGLVPGRDDWGGINFMDSHSNSIQNAVFKYAYEVAFMDHSYLNLKNVEISDSDDAFFAMTSNIDADNTNGTNLSGSFLYAINSSNVNLSNSSIDTIQSDAIYIYDSSTLNLSNFSIKNVSNGSAINVFDSSTLNISDSSIKNVENNTAIYVFQDSSLTADNLQAENVNANWNYAVNVFDGSHLVLNHSSLKNCSGYACLAFYDGDDYLTTPSSIDIENSTLDGGTGSGILTYGGGNISATINHSTIKNFANYSIEDYASFPIHAENNWWGNATGPYNETKNPTGTAGSIFNPVYPDNVEFIPFCTSEKCKTRNPVILIPGITGTYLLKDNDNHDEVWPNLTQMLLPGDDLFLNYLALETDGTENPDRPVLLDDIIRGAVGVHVFNSLIDELTANGYTENTDLFTFPYDWRKSSAENATLLKNKIEEVLSKTGAEKVDLVAHSMGGLIAKKYIADNSGDKIDKLIFLGTPHLGAPKAFKVLMYGDNMGFNTFFHLVNILKPSTAKIISQNMPAVYELLPSEKYVSDNGDYVINAVDKNNPINLDYGETKDLMIEKGRNSLIFPFAEKLHDGVDNLDLSTVNTYNFVGCGTKTIGQIITKRKRSWTHLWLTWEDDYDLKYVNGDETVPLFSADGISTNNKYFVKNTVHGSLPSGDGAKEDVRAILKGDTLPTSPDILTDVSNCNISGKVVSTHSPVELHIYDENGNHTGLNTDGDIEENIPNVQYDVIEGEDFAFLPDGINYKIVTKATDTGGFNFQIKDEDKNDNITDTYDWTLIPLETLQAQGEIWVGPSYPESDYAVQMDEDGNGTVDQTFPISFDGTAEAEKETNPPILPINHGGYSSGGGRIIINQQKTEPITQVETIPNKVLADIGITNQPVIKNVNKSILTQNKLLADSVSLSSSEQISSKFTAPLTAEANNSGVKINQIWLIMIIIGVGFIVGILAKRFIKS